MRSKKLPVHLVRFHVHRQVGHQEASCALGAQYLTHDLDEGVPARDVHSGSSWTGDWRRNVFRCCRRRRYGFRGR